MLKTNEKKLVEFLAPCQPVPPKTKNAWSVAHDGQPFLLPQFGGITLNIEVGDTAFGWEGDHVEPGVSCMAETETTKPLEHPNSSVQIYS